MSDTPERALVAAPDQVPGGSPSEAEELDTDTKLARVLCSSSKHKSFNDIPELVVRMAVGRSLGLTRLEAINSVITVDGKPTFTAGFISARIKGSRRYNYRVVEKTPTSCAIDFYEWGQYAGREVFTIQDAKRAGLLRSGSAWLTYPASMLFARCITSGARTHCPDIFYGFGIYTSEEIGGPVLLDETQPPPPQLTLEDYSEAVYAATEDSEPE